MSDFGRKKQAERKKSIEGVKVRKLFSELSELRDEGDQSYWKQTARWVKFEESVEEGGERWSKPRVATLSLAALTELRNLISEKTVVLDETVETIDDVAELVKTKYKDELTEEQHNSIFDDLTSKAHIKQHHNKTPRDGETDKRLENVIEEGTNGPTDSPRISNKKVKYNTAFMRKVPQGTEAHLVLLAELPLLSSGTEVSLFVRLKSPKFFEGLTEIEVPTKFVTILFRSVGSTGKEIARAISTLMSDDVFRVTAYMATTPQALQTGIDEFMSASTVLPPCSWDPDTRVDPPDKIPSQMKRMNSMRGAEDEGQAMLEQDEEDEDNQEELVKEWRANGLLPSGRLFGGLVGDIKRRMPKYWSDIKDAFCLKAVASFFFIYFACLSTHITFGGIHADATDNYIGTEEGLLAAALCGCIYAMFSAQPLTILGCTGPVLVFESIMYQFCKSSAIDYLSFRFWTGTWSAIILLIIVAVDASFLVVYITRFTEECFATLIAIIFIYESFKSLFHVYDQLPFEMHVDRTHGHGEHHGNLSIATESIPTTLPSTATNSTGDPHPEADYVPDVFLFSCLLFLGTFTLAYGLKMFKNTRFFPTKVREVLSDFAAFLSIVIMTLVSVSVGVGTPKLHVPSKFEPTRSEDRGWLVDPMKGMENKGYIFAALIPAILFVILVFLDTTITLVIVNRKENKFVKGVGYHLDVFVVALLCFLSAALGLPYFVAATVRSMVHVNSLKVESEAQAPGEKATFLGVKEQRVTAFMAHLAIGLSVLMGDVLRHVPMPVLYGMFLFMGVTSLPGIEFFERILVFFMPLKHQPDRDYLRKVRPKRVYLFTACQLLGFIALYLIKHFKQTCIAFPLMIMALIGIRKLLDFVFTPHELKVLDQPLPAWSLIKSSSKETKDINKNEKI